MINAESSRIMGDSTDLIYNANGRTLQHGNFTNDESKTVERWWQSAEYYHVHSSQTTQNNDQLEAVSSNTILLFTTQDTQISHDDFRHAERRILEVEP